MYYGSYRSPRVLLWSIGVIILILLMAIAFLGYVLPVELSGKLLNEGITTKFRGPPKASDTKL
jgi:quinol-cytochrome oxidoreductase complex cytochrome b subunit